MFGWFSCAVNAASPMNICTSSGRPCSAVCIVLMTMRFSKPCAPLIFARQTSAIPPAARREPISYLLNSVPGLQVEGSGPLAGADSVWVLFPMLSARDAREGSGNGPLSFSVRSTAGWAINGASPQNLTRSFRNEGWMTIPPSRRDGGPVSATVPAARLWHAARSAHAVLDRGVHGPGSFVPLDAVAPHHGTGDERGHRCRGDRDRGGVAARGGAGAPAAARAGLHAAGRVRLPARCRARAGRLGDLAAPLRGGRRRPLRHRRHRRRRGHRAAADAA